MYDWTKEQKQDLFTILADFWPSLFFSHGGKHEKRDVIAQYMGALTTLPPEEVMRAVKEVYNSQEKHTPPTVAALKGVAHSYVRKNPGKRRTGERPCSFQEFKESVAAGRVSLDPKTMDWFERTFLGVEDDSVREPGEEG